MKIHDTLKSALLLLALLALCAGCSDDPADPDPDPEPEAYPWPETREQLMDNFRRAYDEMDDAEYELVLHEDFTFLFTNNDIWDRADDLASTRNMFEGEPGVDEYGNLVPGVETIAVNTFTIIGAWTQMDATHPHFPDAWQALYDVQIVLFHEGGDRTMTITSEQLFYVRPEEVDTGDGTLRTRMFLVGQRDRESGAFKNEDSSWGQIKATYR